MTSGRLQYLPILFAALVASATPSAAQTPATPAADSLQLPPYKMLRSLQFVQDAVVRGDHSAGEMQRYILGTAERNRDILELAQGVFDDFLGAFLL